MGLDRRGFLKIAASLGAGATAGILFTPLPWKLLDDVSIWTQNWSWIPSLRPGADTHAHVVSKTCPSAVAVTVRMVGGRPVRVLPHNDHQLGGGVTSIAAAELQLLHSPARVKAPMRRNADGSFTQLKWSEAAELMYSKLVAAGKKVAFISGDENGSVNEVVSAFADAIETSDVFLMPSEAQSASVACDIMGLAGGLGYDIENSDYVFAAGANILETWGTTARNRRAFAASRPHSGAGSGATFAYAGPMQNNTAAVATPWLPIYPGTETALLLGIAAGLIAAGKTAPASDFRSFAQLAERFTPAETAKITGVSPEKLQTVIDGLLKAEAPLVIAGSESGQGAGAAPVIAAFAVNALLGNINKKGGIRLLPEAPTALSGALSRRELFRRDLPEWIAKKPAPDVLIINEANPIYALPNPKATAAVFKGIPFKAAFASFMDETAVQCDLILPIPMGFERIDDVINPYGCGRSIYCASLPVSYPNADTRSTANSLLFLAQQMDLNLGVNLYEDLLAKKAGLMRANFDLLMKGVPAENDRTVAASSFALRPDLLDKAVAAAKQPEADRQPTKAVPGSRRVALGVYAKLNLGTPTTGIPPFSLKTLRAAELAGPDMAVMINAATAGKNGLTEGARVKLTADGQSITGFVRLFEGVMNDTVAVCSGFGRSAFDAFSRGKGANVMELLRAAPESGSGLTVWSGASVEIAKA